MSAHDNENITIGITDPGYPILPDLADDIEKKRQDDAYENGRSQGEVHVEVIPFDVNIAGQPADEGDLARQDEYAPQRDKYETGYNDESPNSG